MEEMSKHGRIGQAAMKADMDRKTARKYIDGGKFPSELTTRRDWRTRVDPFEEHWSEVVERLTLAPELEAKALFEALQAEHPERYEDGQLRTLQRRIRWWRAAHGPDQEVSLAQQHRSGEAAQTDFTHTGELAVTIVGQLFVHMLCVLVLPYSNWQWATVCLSESMVALRKGVQRALFQIGRVPEWHQTDNSTSATHRISGDQVTRVDGSKRPFNAEYVKLMAHLGMKPRTIAIGESKQNGDVEASNGAIKRRLNQALLLRGSRDFESVDAWQAFVDEVARKANKNRGRRVAEDLAAMRELVVTKLPEYVVEEACVSDWSTIRIKQCAYSVPSRLIGSWVRVWIFEDKIEVYFAGELELACERLRGRNLRRIDYRHMIKSLVRKPGGFARYVYREEMFPSLAFRRAYDAIQTPHRATKGDLEYLRILDLAACTMEADVTIALEVLLTEKATITVTAVKALIASTSERIDVPALVQPMPDLAAYDALLTEAAA
jgi:hypothetical protein